MGRLPSTLPMPSMSAARFTFSAIAALGSFRSLSANAMFSYTVMCG